MGRERGGPTQQHLPFSQRGHLDRASTSDASTDIRKPHRWRCPEKGQESPSGRRHDTPQRYRFAKGLTVEILSWSRRGHNSKPIWGYFKCRAPFSCPFQLHHPKGYPKPLKTPRCIYTGTCNQQGKQPLSW